MKLICACLVALVVVVGLSGFVLVTGCETVQSVAVSGSGGSDLDAPTGSIALTFRDVAGKQVSVPVSPAPRPRGWDQSGKWHGLGEAKDLAYLAFRSGVAVRGVCVALRWGEWDTLNAEIVERALVVGRADPLSL